MWMKGGIVEQTVAMVELAEALSLNIPSDQTTLQWLWGAGL
jgi:hypothetical protein